MDEEQRKRFIANRDAARRAIAARAQSVDSFEGYRLIKRHTKVYHIEMPDDPQDYESIAERLSECIQKAGGYIRDMPRIIFDDGKLAIQRVTAEAYRAWGNSMPDKEYILELRELHPDPSQSR